jgi:type I restriction enzyme S subunit
MNWPLVPLGEVLTRCKDEVTLQDLTTYARLTIRLNGRGIDVRDRLLGAEIGTKRQFLARTGQLVLSKIDARNGAFGILPKEGDQAIITGNFWAFDALETRLDASFLRYLTLTQDFVNFCIRASEGTTNRRYLQEEKFLQQVIPLPPVEEQRRIVARVDAIASRTTEARRLREEANAEVTACFVSERSLCFRTSATGRTVPLSEGAHLERGRFLHRPRNEPRFFGGPHPWIQIGEVEAAKKYISRYTTTLNDLGLAISRKFPSGTLLVSIAATIGAVGILGFDCCVPDSIVAVQPKEGVDTEYLFHWIGYARSDLERLAPQSAQKNINLQILSELPLPLPPLDEQRRIVEHLDALEAKLDAVRAEQQASAAELDALLPSVLNRAFAGQL